MGRIDPATGRNKRDKVRFGQGFGGPRRKLGKVVRKGKLEHQRDRKTGRK